MRKTGWQTALVGVLKDPKFKAFEWGVSDCCMLVADCCVAVSGKDPTADYRGKYDSEIGAIRTIKALSIEDAMDAHYQRVPVELAQRGDAVMLGDMSVGVLWSGGVWTIDKDRGLAKTDKTPLIAWRVE